MFSVLDEVTSGGKEFHVRDAAAGKARSLIITQIFLSVNTEMKRLGASFLLDNLQHLVFVVTERTFLR